MLKASKHEASRKIRSRLRAVGDYDVDRLQVQGRQRPEPSSTNRPRAFSRRNKTRIRQPQQRQPQPGRAALTHRVESTVPALFAKHSLLALKARRFQSVIFFKTSQPPSLEGVSEKENQGGYSTRVPPLPIPNREVKPRHADGTAKVGE